MHDVCVLGHLTRDRIRIADRPRRSLPGGTVWYAGIAYARLGFDTAVVTKLGAADAAELLVGLREAGVATHWTAVERTTVFDNDYEDASQQTRVQYVQSLAPPMAETDLGDVAARFYHVGALTQGEVPLPLLATLVERGGRIALDVQGMVRAPSDDSVRLVPWRDRDAGLRLVEVVKADAREARLLTGEGDPAAAAVALGRLGPSEAIVTLGGRGAVVHHDGRIHRVPPVPARVVADATGCGDTFLAAYVVFRSRGESVRDAAHLAAAAATLALENVGPLRATEPAIRTRANASP